MKVIEAYSPDEALVRGVNLLLEHGVRQNSRNGPVLAMQEPTATVFKNPSSCTGFLPERDGNVFFHIFESLWMLAGRSDLKSLLLLNSGMSAYSDDGQLVRGSAYGARWRNWFNYDQIEDAIKKLHADPETRRVVLTQWDAATDPVVDSRDIPCNLQTVLSIRANGKLDVMVTNRSNDVIYGQNGSNVVHFSLTMNYLASALRVPMGEYTQLSNNLHGYTDNAVWQKVAERVQGGYSQLLEELKYDHQDVQSLPLFDETELKSRFDEDNTRLMDMISYFASMGYAPSVYLSELHSMVFQTKFFNEVMQPLLLAWFSWKEYKRAGPALEHIPSDTDIDWLVAGREWLLRRKKQ